MDEAKNRVLRLYEQWRTLTHQQTAAMVAGDAENAATLAGLIRLVRGELRRLREPPHERSHP